MNRRQRKKQAKKRRRQVLEAGGRVAKEYFDVRRQNPVVGVFFEENGEGAGMSDGTR